MKVCILTSSYPRYSGDYAGKFVHNLAKELIKNKVDITVIAPHDIDTPSHDIIDGVSIYRFQYWFTKKGQKLAYGAGIPENLKIHLLAKIQLPFFLFCLWFKSIFIAKQCNIIHAQFLLTGFVAIFLKYLIKIPLITTVHGSDIRGIKHSFITNFLLSKIDYFISGHPELTQILARIQPSKKINEIPNIIDFGKFETEQKEKSIQIINKEFHLKTEKIITFIARLIDFYDPKTFINSIPEILKECKNVRFFMIGDGPLMDEIKTLQKEYNLGKQLIITGFRKDVRRFLLRSNIFIGISPTENIWAMTIIEAISLNVPCILTDAGYTKQIFSHKKNVYLIPPKDPKALIKAILTLLKDEKLMRKISKNAKKLLEDKGFSNEKIIQSTIQLYKKSLAT